MGYFKEYMNYIEPFFSELGFNRLKGSQFEQKGEPFSNVFEFVSYVAGTSFKVKFGVRSRVFNKIFEEIMGWGLNGEYVLYVTSQSSFFKILKSWYDVESELDFPQRSKEVEEAFYDYALPFYAKNNSYLAIRDNLRKNEIFRPMIGNTNFHLFDWKMGVFLDLFLTILLEPEKFDESVEHYRIKCTTKHPRGFGSNPEEIIDYSRTYNEVETEFLPKLANVNWDVYRKKLKI